MTRVSGDWLTSASTQRMFSLYAQAGFALYAVGGCVRNDLLGQPVSDIDMASDAPPDAARAFLEKSGVKVVPTGIDHGTITAVTDGTAFEITTFRKDVETHGRHATVAFSTDMADDAARRDFTMNALYADANGRVFDPVQGISDVSAQRVRFIGNAQDRIREDFLRTLRFFRFHAWYAGSEAGFDPDALDAMASNLDGLEILSRERVCAEILKLLTAPDPVAEVMVMQRIGVLARILPGADARAFGPLVHLEAEWDHAPDPILRLAVLCTPDQAKSLKLSKARLRRIEQLHAYAFGPEAPGEIGYRLGLDNGIAAVLLRCAVLEQPITGEMREAIERGAEAKFPIKAKDLAPHFRGPALGAKLRELEKAWIASGFTASKDQLLG